MKLKKSEIESAIATAVISALILLVLLLCGMTAHRNEMDEGVMVSLGYADDGFGQMMPETAPEEVLPVVPEKPAVPVKPVAPVAQTEEDLMTQEDPSVALEAERRKREREERIAREREERLKAEREEAERIERERREAEAAARKKAEEEAKERASALAGSAFQNMGKGQGTSKGDSQQGNPVGKGSQGGHSWSLNGRNLVGYLAQPSYHGNEEGKIVVAIRVDANGNVTSAEIAKGTTITNEKMRNEAVAAARKNRFSTGGGIAIGNIVYNFRLN